MDNKVIIVKRKKKKPKDKPKSKPKPKPKAKPKPKPKPKETMEQKVSQNVKVIINERANPTRKRRRQLTVRGFNTPRLQYQNPTIIHKGLDAQSAMNSFQGIYNTRLSALERGLDGINGNITTLQNTLQNNRQVPLNEQRSPLTEETVRLGQEILNQQIIANEQARRIQELRVAEKDHYNTQRGENDIPFNIINPIESRDPRQAEEAEEEEELVGQSNPDLLEPVVSARAEVIGTAPAENIEFQKVKSVQELKQEMEDEKKFIFTESQIREANSSEIADMINQLGRPEGKKFIDVSGKVKSGSLTEAKKYVRDVRKELFKGFREKKKLFSRGNF